MWKRLAAGKYVRNQETHYKQECNNVGEEPIINTKIHTAPQNLHPHKLAPIDFYSFHCTTCAKLCNDLWEENSYLLEEKHYKCMSVIKGFLTLI